MKALLLSTTFFCCLSALTGCDTEVNLGQSPQKFSYDFNLGAQNWQVAYSDYPADYEQIEIYEREHGIRPLPAGFSGQGLMISGHNHSADLFMFMKRRISGLTPSTRYKANVNLSFLSNIGIGCYGAGGSPGESVYMKFGYAETEPMQEGYYLNVPKGNQAEGGAQAKVIGNIATKGANCEDTAYKNKTIKTSVAQELEFTTNADGSIWIFIGTDSGFEGLTTLYYRSVELTFNAR